MKPRIPRGWLQQEEENTAYRYTHIQTTHTIKRPIIAAGSRSKRTRGAATHTDEASLYVRSSATHTRTYTTHESKNTPHQYYTQHTQTKSHIFICLRRAQVEGKEYFHSILHTDRTQRTCHASLHTAHARARTHTYDPIKNRTPACVCKGKRTRHSHRRVKKNAACVHVHR